MKANGKIPTYLGASILLVFGVVYAIKMEFMAYHSDAMGMDWSDLGHSQQILFLAGMKIASAAFISAAGAIIFLQYQFGKNKLKWIPGLILFIGALNFIGIFSAILIVLLNTPGTPPYWFAAIGFVLLLVGFGLNIRSSR